MNNSVSLNSVKQVLGPNLVRFNAFLRLYKRERAALVGTGVLFFFVIVALLAEYVAPYGPLKLGTDRFSPPSPEHLLGTDNLGRDVFSRVLYGSRISLLIGFLAVLTSVAIGVVVGAISGYFGGVVDDLLMRISEFFQVIPRFFLVITLTVVFGSTIWNVILAIGILSWPQNARLIRAQFLSLKEREYVLAARSLGAGSLDIVFNEILPNSMSPVIANFSLEVGFAILIESGLGFLGLADPSVISWGNMLRDAALYLRQAWWCVVFPGFSIALVVLSLSLIGDGLNNILNPKRGQGFLR